MNKLNITLAAVLFLSLSYICSEPDIVFHTNYNNINTFKKIENSLYVSSQGGIIVLDNNFELLEQYNITSGLYGNNIKDLFVFDVGLAALPDEGGLDILKNDQSSHISVSDGLSDNNIKSALLFNEEIWLIPLNANGIDIYNVNNETMNNLSPSQMDDRYANCIDQFNSDILIGCESGIMKYEDGRFKLISGFNGSVDLMNSENGKLYVTNREFVYLQYSEDLNNWNDLPRFELQTSEQILHIKGYGESLFIITNKRIMKYNQTDWIEIDLPDNTSDLKYYLEKDNMQYLGTKNGLFHKENNSDDWNQFVIENIIGDNYINSIFIDSSQRVWATHSPKAGQEGLSPNGFSVMNNSGRWISFNRYNSPVSNDYIYHTTEDQDGNNWLFEWSSKAYMIDSGTSFENLNETSQWNIISEISVGVGSAEYNGDIYFYDLSPGGYQSANIIHRYKNMVLESGYLSTKRDVFCFDIDSDGIGWYATTTGEISKTDLNSFPNISNQTAYNTESKFIKIFADKTENMIWFLGNGHIVIYDKNRDMWNENQWGSVVTENTWVDIKKDENGKILCLSENNGFFHYDYDSDTFTQYNIIEKRYLKNASSFSFSHDFSKLFTASKGNGLVEIILKENPASDDSVYKTIYLNPFDLNQYADDFSVVVYDSDNIEILIRKIEIYSINGDLLIESETSSIPNEKISELTSGIYILLIHSEDKTFQNKLAIIK